VLDVVSGRPFLGHETVATGVAYLSLEDPVGRLLDALTETNLGAEVPEELLLLGSDTVFSLEELPEFMTRYVAGLWVIDPLPAAWDPEESFGYQVEYTVGHGIKLLADKHRAAVIVTGHAGKRWDVNAVTAGTGTVGLPGAADNRWLISKKAGSRANLHVQGGRRLPGGPAIPLAFDGFRFHTSGARRARGLAPRRTHHRGPSLGRRAANTQAGDGLVRSDGLSAAEGS
jgi:hypothetical protein